MAIASLFIGIASGLVGFAAALILGYGVLMALAGYVLAGIAGMSATLGCGLVASRAEHPGAVSGATSRA